MGGKTHKPAPQDRRSLLAEREQALAALARRQHGIVSRRQLLAAGVSARSIERRLESGRLHRLHRGVYAVGHTRLNRYGRWMAGVLACGEGAVLSHHSAAALWGLMRPRASPVDVTSSHGRPGRPGIRLHRAHLHPDERTDRGGIPVTSLPRTLLDLAEVVDESRLERAFEEADRLGLLQMRALERVCERGVGRRGLGACRRPIAAARAPTVTRSRLEDRFAAFCRKHELPPAAHNVHVLGHEVDAFWPRQRLVVELDSFEFHKHRAAFERDRAKDSALQAAGYRVVRLTHRRLETDAAAVVAELRGLLAGDASGGGGEGRT